MKCPTCQGPVGELAIPDAVAVVDQFCDSCSTRLRFRLFHGEVIDLEDLDLHEPTLTRRPGPGADSPNAERRSPIGGAPN